VETSTLQRKGTRALAYPCSGLGLLFGDAPSYVDLKEEKHLLSLLAAERNVALRDAARRRTMSLASQFIGRYARGQSKSLRAARRISSKSFLLSHSLVNNVLNYALGSLARSPHEELRRRKCVTCKSADAHCVNKRALGIASVIITSTTV